MRQGDGIVAVLPWRRVQEAAQDLIKELEYEICDLNAVLERNILIAQTKYNAIPKILRWMFTNPEEYTFDYKLRCIKKEWRYYRIKSNLEHAKEIKQLAEVGTPISFTLNEFQFIAKHYKE